MVSLTFGPEWFFHQSIVFEVIFAIITLLVAFYSFKIYKLTKEKAPLLLGFGFLSFSISYIIQSFLNLGIMYKLSKTVEVFQEASKVINLGLSAQNIHILLMITGLAIISYISLKSKNPKTILLLLSISIYSIFSSKNPVLNFLFISVIYLIFISYYYLSNYSKIGKTSVLLVFLTFALLLFSNISYIVALEKELFYVMGHFLELAAYIIIFINLKILMKK